MKLGKFDRIGVDRAAAGPRTGRARFSARFPGGNGEKGWECFAKAYVETGAADRSAPVVRNDAARSAGGPRSTEPCRPWPKKTPLTPAPLPKERERGSESPLPRPPTGSGRSAICRHFLTNVPSLPGGSEARKTRNRTEKFLVA